MNPYQYQKSISGRPLPIKPPRSIKRTYCRSSSATTYSLFDSSMSPSLDWLSNKEFDAAASRKYSVSVDGSDSPNNDHTGFWRRASSPTIPTLSKNLNDSKENYNIPSPTTTVSSLPAALDFFNKKYKLIGGANYSWPSNLSPSLVYPDEEVEGQDIGGLLSQSSLVDTTPPIFYCIRISNIPWDVSQKDVISFFQGFEMSIPLIQAQQSIHIMMDRTTGKTLSDCYIEFTSKNEALRAIQYGNQKLLKGRLVSVFPCSTEELLAVTFPRWQSGFIGNRANSPSSIRNGGIHHLITRNEINSLLLICKNYKHHFSRKCAERPFENIITIITKYPWEQSDLFSPLQRDHIFELLKLSIESLKVHLSKVVVHIDSTLLERMVRAGIMCPKFTELQKAILLQTTDTSISCLSNVEESFMSNSRKAISCLDNSYIHVVTNLVLQQQKSEKNNVCCSSLLNILNDSTQFHQQEAVGDNKNSNIGTTESSSGDEDSYCFCEQEDDDDDGSFYKI